MDLKYCWILCACKYDGVAFPVDLKVLREGGKWHGLLSDAIVDLAFANIDPKILEQIPTGYVVEVRFAKISVSNTEIDNIESITQKISEIQVKE